MAKQTVTIKDLLERKNLRSRVYPIDDLGSVEIHELTAVESEELADGHIKDDEKAEGRRITRWVGRFMMGYGNYPTEDEVTALMENNSSDVLVEIFQKGMAFSAVDVKAKASAEKN